MNTRLSLLLPRPQGLESTNARFTVPDEPVIDLASSAPQMRAIAKRLAEALEAGGRRSRFSAAVTERPRHREAHLRFRVHPGLLSQPQSYHLVIDETGITVVGADEAGLFYGLRTLDQLLHLHAPHSPREPLTLPGLRITDWPDFPRRGVLLDVSRDKVPTMETLFSLVDLLASWKINQVQLYMEHTFAYRGHEVVWQRSSPVTGAEIEALDAFCRDRYVELVPNQNSFGHMHRWLIHGPYRRLAECPEGLAHPFSVSPEPYGLCPIDPRSLALLADLYDQLLPHFSSRQFNVGLDETFDLGQGRSAPACAERGVEGVYLEFLEQVHRLVTQRGRIMQFWADMIRDRPALIGKLPKDAIALEWGYEADHPFAEHGRLFADAGLQFYVCPGTSSWNSFVGRTANALANISNAAMAGRVTGAIGLLTTDWGDNGHLQPLPVSYLGFVAGAAFSWNSTTAEPGRLDIPALLSLHAFGDRAGVMGRLAYDLGNAYLHTRVPLHNGTAPFHLLVFADRDRPRPPLERLSVERLEETRAYIDEVVAPLSDARMARPDAETILKEVRWGADMLRLACRLGMARLQIGLHMPISALPARLRAEFGDELRTLIGRHRELWRSRNRPGGLDDSAARLERILALLAA
jgi:hypothetical protein